MKKLILTLAMLTAISLSIFAQQEMPMFFDDSNLRLQTNNGVQAIAYSPDGNKIAIAPSSNKISIIDTASGKEVRQLSGHNTGASIYMMVFSPNGRLLASYCYSDSTLKIWNVESGQMISSITQSNVQHFSFNHDGSRIAGTFGSGNNSGVKIWNTANGTEVRTLTGHTGTVYSVVYSTDGRQILTASMDCSIRIWNAENGQTIRTITSEYRFDYAIFSTNGQNMAAYTWNRATAFYAIKIFNAQTGQEIRSFPARLGPRNLRYSPDGRQLLVNAWIDDGNTKTITIFDPDTGRELRSFITNDDAIAYSPDGRRILTKTTFLIGVENTYYGALFATLLDSTTGKTVGTIGYGPLNVGAKAYADMQIARFLNNTAEVTKNEAILKFITDKGYATRAEIETFYKNNVAKLISEVVDEEFKGITIPTSTVTYVKQSLTNFFTTPNQANFNIIKTIFVDEVIYYEEQLLFTNVLFMEVAKADNKKDAEGDLRNQAMNHRNILNNRLRQLNAPTVNDLSASPINWRYFSSAYVTILRRLNTEVVKTCNFSPWWSWTEGAKW